MSTQVENILPILQKLIGLHRQLHEVCRNERDALVAADVKQVQEFTHAKELVIETIRHEEAKRLRLTAEIALEMKRPMAELTLSNLIMDVEPVQPKLAEQLRSAMNALVILIERASKLNQSNLEFIERSLGHVHNMKKNVLGEAVPRSETYGAHGQKLPHTSGARLISKEA